MDLIELGRKAPVFTLPDQDGEKHALKELAGGPVVLFFYPLDFTFVCPTEIVAFSDRYEDFKQLNAEVLGVSIDSKYSHLAWLEKPRDKGGLGGLAYPLVSDLKREIATAYDVLDEAEGVALRGLFVIDPEGMIQHATINNLAFGRSVEETLRVLNAIVHVQKVGAYATHESINDSAPDATFFSST